MLRKILLSSILILVVGCGGKSFKNGVYEGLIGKDRYKLIINNNKVELIYIDLNNNTSYYSKVSNKNENDKDIIYYITDKNGFKLYLGLKQTNDNSIVVYNMPTVACRNSMLSYNAGFIDKEMLNSIIDIYSIDINKPSIFEKVEEK
ncbi:hypothetical protein EPJ70_11980 [Brachyspira aalborgi]|uniref:Lipoprotein n=1 Tax=Brachyspira aalborgi TaxID=29522 RepID=A0A5C8F0G4_9SPIR|nr:hypothetical protein [Brachyspira aalborgi]TXJ42661.1 hypothetical protein EPJ70_11980 [Brachyspira aalborgi]